MASDPEQRKVYQPLHPRVRPLLDPQYVAFHDAHMQYVQPDDQKVWDGSARTQPSLPRGTSDPIPVGQTQDIVVGAYGLRVFTPTGTAPASGWPVFVWYHGGGWAIGGIESENDFCTQVCEGAKVVVCTVGYRLAPEHRFPAAVDDAYEALAYLSSKAGASHFNLDASRVAVGGTSAGANLSLAAIVRLIQEHPNQAENIRLQVLIVPVVDNTATSSTVWAPNAETAPWLTPKRMVWYRHMYMPNEDDWTHWKASPNLAPSSVLSKMPKTWFAVSEQDVLAPEGIAFAKQLSGLGVQTELTILEGCTHSILAMNGVMDKGAKLVEDAIAAIHDALN